MTVGRRSKINIMSCELNANMEIGLKNKVLKLKLKKKNHVNCSAGS